MSEGFLALFIPTMVFGIIGGILGGIMFTLAYRFGVFKELRMSDGITDAAKGYNHFMFKTTKTTTTTKPLDTEPERPDNICIACKKYFYECECPIDDVRDEYYAGFKEGYDQAVSDLTPRSEDD